MHYFVIIKVFFRNTFKVTVMDKFLCIIGTRPEVIKMAPIILQLQKEPWAKVRIIATAQHREMLDQMTKLFNITPDVDLNLMQINQTLPNLTARILTKLAAVLAEEKAQAVIAQGDTTTVFATALACFYNNIPFYHVEAGLRSHDLRNPFPEEINRVLAAQLATLNFAPTETAKKNLLREGISADSIYITGNTIIDALFYIAGKDIHHDFNIDLTKRLVLVTAHRRENFGEPLREICKAIRDLADAMPDIQILYPVHPNPQVTKVVNPILSNHSRIL